MKKNNIIWFVVDGARQYKKGLDDRDRIDAMDHLAKEGVEFTNAFTPAPSSILAASTMLTGLPAAYISRHYNDFIFDSSQIDSLVPMLKDNGYNIYSIFDARALRSAMQDMAYSLPSKFRPKIAKHDEFWHNKALTDNVKHLFVNNYVNTPAFFLIWYNCRKDPNTSKHVEEAIEIFKENNLWEESIVIMNSDHGYPDPSTGLTKEIMKKYSHDMIITDDNINVPLIIKYPDCPKGKKIDNVVRMSDVFHTIIDCLKIPIQDTNKINYSNPENGSSLLRMIEGKDDKPRIARIDTRLNMAFGRVSALRTDHYKYIYYCETDKEEFYSMKNDPYELENIIDSKDQLIINEINRLRNIYKQQEEQIFNYHLNQLRNNIQNELKKNFPVKSKIKNIIITFNALTPAIVIESLTENIKDYFGNIEINLLTQDKLKSKYENTDLQNIYTFPELTDEYLSNSDVMNKKFDLVIYLTDNSRHRFVNTQIVSMLKGLKGKKFIMLDFNFKIYSRLLSKWIYPLIRFVKRNWRYYKDEPTMFPRELWLFVKSGFRMYVLGKTSQTFEAEEIKITRDSKLKEHGFSSDDLLEDIWDDRISDDNKRDEINKDFLKDKQ